MSIKTFLMRKMLASKMKDVPKEQQDKIFNAIEKDPAFFEKIALEIQEKTKAGKDQMTASMEVMQKYQADLQKLMN
jgi:hypothetical protein